MSTWFVTRHQGAVNWASEEGLEIDQAVNHLELHQLKDNDIVIGTLPINLVAELTLRGIRYWHLVLSLPPESRGKELSASIMRENGARLQEYRVEIVAENPVQK